MREDLISFVATVVVGSIVAALSLGFWLHPFAVLLTVPLLVLLLVYLFFCFTYVAEGTAKNVIRFDGYRKTLLVKKGHKLNSNGYVVQLQPGERPQYPEFFGGLRWVSLLKPLGIDRIYSRTMRYVKALPDGTFERRADENTDFILVAQFQYGLEFTDAEDSKGLHCSGKMTMTVWISSPYRALFLVREWFDALVGRVLPRVRQYISEHEYDKIINDPGTQMDKDVFEMLQRPDKSDLPNKRSILQILHEEYGIELVALETVNIDPPKEYRETTLRKYTAQQNAEAESEETGGALDRIIDRRISKLADRLGMDADQIKQHLKDNPPVFHRIEEIGLDLLRRDRAGKAGPGLRDIRVGGTDGSKIDPITANLMAMIELWKGASGNQPTTPGGQGQQGSAKKGVNKKSSKEMTDQEANDYLDKFLDEEEDVDEEEEEGKK